MAPYLDLDLAASNILRLVEQLTTKYHPFIAMPDSVSLSLTPVKMESDPALWLH